jgi:class 3 adenylate cyclase
MRDALAMHDALAHAAVAVHDGYLVKTTGDGAHAAFTTARAAIDAAVDAELAIALDQLAVIAEGG